MAMCTFLFDAVATEFEAPNQKIEEPAKLIIEMVINKIKMPITTSRINVSDFVANRNKEFGADPEALRQSLEECGIPVVLRYKGMTLGTGQIILEPSIISQISAEMSDLVIERTCNIERKGKLVGNLKLMFSLVIKCVEQPKPEDTDRINNIGAMSKSIPDQDILFIFGPSQPCPIPCDSCLDTLDPEEGDARLALDLKRYNLFNRRVRSEDVIKEHWCSPAVADLKKLSREYEEIIDSVSKSMGHSKDICTDQKKAFKVISALTRDENETIDDDRVAAGGGGDLSQSDDPNTPCSPAKAAPKEIVHPRTFPVPITNNGDEKIKPTRFCPVCLTNMSWMPKFACCPKCGAKPMPIIEERHKEPLTADQILLEYLGKPHGKYDDDVCPYPCKTANKEEGAGDCEDNGGDGSAVICTDCRCTCKHGKMCAHCRIRKMCADFFKPNELKCPKVKPQSSEDFCVKSECSDENRPYLARVFSELRELYEVKGTVKCSPPGAEDQSVLPPRKKPKLSKPDTANAKCDQKIPQTRDTGVKIGHKECVHLRKTVSRHHGWAWTKSAEARKHGWRPGAISKSTESIMKFFLEKSKNENSTAICKTLENAQKEFEQQLPILHVNKRRGQIFITMRALNNPSVYMKPITFRVVKSDLAVAMRDIKQKLKDKGFLKCTCHKSVMLCVCRHYMEKKKLELEIEKECHRRLIPSCVDHLVLTDTSDSEMEFDFDVTPPAGLARTMKHSRTATHSTQTNSNDFKVKPKYPTTLGPYWRAFNCAVGDRFVGTSFGKPGEAVFEDGAFGFFGGGPHGTSVCPGARKKSTTIWGSGGPGGPMRGGRFTTPLSGGSVPKGFPGGEKTGHFRIPSNKGVPGTGKQQAGKGKKGSSGKDGSGDKNEQQGNKKSDVLVVVSSRNPIIADKTKETSPKDARKRRRGLMEMPIPPLDSLKKRGKPIDPCAPVCCKPCQCSCGCCSC